MELTGKIDKITSDFLTGKALVSLEINEKDRLHNGYDDLHKCEKLSIKLVKYRKRRSLDANAYAWQLINKLAESQGLSKEEVYRHYIREMGVCKLVEINKEAVDTLIHSWGLHGLGWIAERVDYAQRKGFVKVNLYYGSSTYNTKQMSRLIKSIVEDCKAVGIETMTPKELERLTSLWQKA